MPEFDMLVTERFYRCVIVTVEAENEDDAYDIATKCLDRGDYDIALANADLKHEDADVEFS